MITDKFHEFEIVITCRISTMQTEFDLVALHAAFHDFILRQHPNSSVAFPDVEINRVLN